MVHGGRLAVAKFIVPDWGGIKSTLHRSQLPYRIPPQSKTRNLATGLYKVLNSKLILNLHDKIICFDTFFTSSSEKPLSSQTVVGAAQYYSVVDFYVFFLCVSRNTNILYLRHL